MKHFLPLLFPLVLPYVISAATITTTATCQPAGTYAITEPDSCRFAITGDVQNNTWAYSSAQYALAGNQLDIQFSQSAAGGGWSYRTFELYENPNFRTDYAGAFGSVTMELDTAGPVRTGYLGLSEPYGSWSGYFEEVGALESLSVGGYSFSCPLSEVDNNPCGLPVDLEYAELYGYKLLPITLGQPFTVTATLTSAVYGYEFDGVDDISAGADVRLQLFDSDGLTPVNVTEVDASATAPEPSHLALTGLLALAGYLLAARLGPRACRSRR